MNNTPEFNRAINRADEYETFLIEFAREHFKKQIEDVREDERFQNMDVDFTVIHEGKAWQILDPYEIKVDFYPENNFFFETVSNKYMNTLGCCLKSEAKYLWYYFAKTDALYEIKVSQLQEFLRSDELTQQYLKHGGDCAIGVCIPIKIFIEFVPCTKIEVKRG